MRIETESGFAAELDEGFRDDWEFVEALDDYMAGRGGSLVPFAKKLLGDNYEPLKEHCRDENGKISAASMTKEIFEIMRLAGKNS